MILNDPLCGYTVIENPALTQPDEKMKRHGQAVAAASLPKGK